MTSRLVASGRRRARQKGGTVIEGALSLLAFLFLTLGLVESSLAVYAYNFCSYAASDAARWASLRGAHSPNPISSADLVQYVRNQAVALTPSRLEVVPTWLPNNHPGSTVQVQVTYTIAPIVNLMLRQNLTVRSTSRMTISN
jgi:Flp pilus assembly protein TadG